MFYFTRWLSLVIEQANVCRDVEIVQLFYYVLFLYLKLQLYVPFFDFVKGCNGQDIMGPSPADDGVLIGENHRLTCRRGDGITSDISWFADAAPNPLLLYLGSNKINTNPEYDNFAVDISGDQFDLLINGIAVEDEGTYFCQLTATGENSASVSRTVEGIFGSLRITNINGNINRNVKAYSKQAQRRWLVLNRLLYVYVCVPVYVDNSQTP